MKNSSHIQLVADDEPTEAAPRYTGVVKWFSAEKCFGFIERPIENGEKLPDIFVHFRGIRGDGWRNLKDNQVVNYEIVTGKKGPQAQDVIVIAEPDQEHSLRPAVVKAVVEEELSLEEAA